MKLDLHGQSVHDAWTTFKDWIYEQQGDNDIKSVNVVTGKGQIFLEFPEWCTDMSFIREISVHKSGGAYQIYFYRKR
jgi:hypothetical protein